MPKQNNLKHRKGFTIIEVVLVLAIAGLIFLMVFIALPALQRSQRNTQRRDDYSMLVTAINSYMASNNGKLSNILGGSNEKYLVPSRWINSTGNDPNGNAYELIAYNEWSDGIKAPGNTTTVVIGGTCSVGGHDTEKKCEDAGGEWEDVTSNEPTSQVFIVIGANCSGVDDNGDPKPAADISKRAFAVWGYLEGDGYFCQASGTNNT